MFLLWTEVNRDTAACKATGLAQQDVIVTTGEIQWDNLDLRFSKFDILVRGAEEEETAVPV